MDLRTSIRRTVVSMVMGWVASLPIAPYVDAAAVETALVAILGALYYAIFRLLEDRGYAWAALAIGLGPTPAPAYHDTGTIAGVPDSEQLDADDLP